jgi:predicted DsbA family dithiol-disulfide isomerase
MSKLLATTLLLGSFAEASTAIGNKVEKYLDNEFGDNPRIKSITIKVIEEKPLPSLKGWDAYIVSIDAVLKNKPKDKINQKMIWFSNGQVITKELVNIDNGEDFTEMVKPNFQKAYYKKENLVYGNANAKHRVAIFSDPLCPFCKSFAPQAMKFMKKDPNKFAVYYYHYPILRIHPASAIITRAAVVAERNGVKDVAIKMYDIKVAPREKDVQKILKAFNKATGANVTEKEIKEKSVVKQIASDIDIAKNVFVSGTPTIYMDDKIDKTRKLYETIK